VKSGLQGCELGLAPPLLADSVEKKCDARDKAARSLFRSVPFPLTTTLFAATCLLACVCVAPVCVIPAAYGQTAPPQNAQAANASVKDASAAEQIPPGTTICAVLEKSLDARKAKAGDAVVAKTTMAVLSHGKVVVASGARVLGHVTQATAHSGNTKSELGVTFDRILPKEGGEIPLELTLQAVGYGGLPKSSDEDVNATYSAVQGIGPGPVAASARHSNFPPPRPEPADTPTAATPGGSPGNPVLEAGSKGVVGIEGMTLAEGKDAGQGSVISAEKKNVKLDRGSQLVLRVVASGPAS